MPGRYSLLDDELELDPSMLPMPAEQGPAPMPQPVSSIPGPQEGLAKLAELYAAQQQEAQAGPGEAERQYLAQNQPQAGWKNVLGAVGSAIAESTGTHGALERFHANQQAARKAYEQGLEQARGIDLGRRPVDRSVAELGVMAGISPEAAKGMSQDSQGLKLLQSGMGQLGARYRQQDLTTEQKAAERELKPELEESRQANRLEMEAAKQANRLALKAAPKPGGAGGGGGDGSSKEALEAARLAYLESQANVTPQEAKLFAAGQTDSIEPEKLARMQRFDRLYAVLPAKQKMALLADASKREAATPDRVNAAVETKRRDPNKRIEYRQQIDDSKAMIREADLAWQSMSPEGKKALAQLSGESWASGALRDAKMSPEDQAKASAIQALANRLIKQTSGAAVSDSEWVRIAREMGLAANNFDVLKGTDAIGKWINRAKGGWARNRAAIVHEMGDLWAK